VDHDPVLRSLAADLEQNDPSLAAFLSSGAVARRHHRAAWVTAGLLPLFALAVTLPITVAIGVLAMLLVIASPLAVCWLCSVADDPPRPENG
jgi:hypothetical protein